MITVNGKPLSIPDGEPLLSLLESRGYRIGVIAVELNGQVLSRESYGATLLRDGDRLEVVSFVGGG